MTTLDKAISKDPQAQEELAQILMTLMHLYIALGTNCPDLKESELMREAKPLAKQGMKEWELRRPKQCEDCGEVYTTEKTCPCDHD